MDRTTRSRRWLGGALALAVGAGISIVGSTGTAQAADINVAKNAGFESGLSNWTCSGGSGANTSSPSAPAPPR